MSYEIEEKEIDSFKVFIPFSLLGEKDFTADIVENEFLKRYKTLKKLQRALGEIMYIILEGIDSEWSGDLCGWIDIYTWTIHTDKDVFWMEAKVPVGTDQYEPHFLCEYAEEITRKGIWVKVRVTKIENLE